MFEIRSFLKKPDAIIRDIENVNRQPELYFVSVDNERGLQQLRKKVDRDYVEGAIVMKYNDATLMDFKLWDLVDQLWAYLLNMMEEYLERGHAKCHFPDQDCKLVMKRFNDQEVFFMIGKQTYRLPRDDFFHSLLNGAEQFFVNFRTYIGPEHLYVDELKRISRQRDHLLRAND